MAKVNQRLWKVPGQRAKRKAWGFTAMENGKQKRHYRAEWTKDDADAELAKVLLGIEQPKAPAAGITFSAAVDRYLAAKARKRTVAGDRKMLEHLKTAFGAETPLAEITAARISAYKADRLGCTSDRTKRPLKAAGINRPLALLRHLLRSAHQEWEVLPTVPTVKLEKEPEGRIRWLEPDEEERLLTACRRSRTKHLAAVVIVALETGMRKGEVLGLTWDRVDFSRGVIRLEVTKSGKRREVAMRQVVDDVLASLPGAREGRVWPSGSIRTAFESAVEAAKLNDDFHFHDARHHFASWFMMQGGSLYDLKEILGHADIKMTTKYAHLSPSHQRAAMLKTERPAPAAVPEDATVRAASVGQEHSARINARASEELTPSS